MSNKKRIRNKTANLRELHFKKGLLFAVVKLIIENAVLKNKVTLLSAVHKKEFPKGGIIEPNIIDDDFKEVVLSNNQNNRYNEIIQNRIDFSLNKEHKKLIKSLANHNFNK